MGLFICGIKAIRSFCRELILVFPRNIRYVKNYYSLKNIQSEKMCVIFLIQNTQVWNSLKTVVEAFLTIDNSKVIIIALPPSVNRELKMDMMNDVFCFLKRNTQAQVIASYDEKKQSFIQLKDLNPDYIFIDEPYTYCYPEGYHITDLANIAPVCYIPYGYNITDNPQMRKIVFDEDLLTYTSFFFADSNAVEEYWKKKVCYSELLTHKRVYSVGYPRFELYKYSDNNKYKYFLWAPRWTTGVQQKMGNYPSTFMKYKDAILSYAIDHPNIHLVIRPHPKMFSNFVRDGIMSEQEVADFKNLVHQQVNVELDELPDYMPSILNADVLIADHTSLLAEFFVMGKPIVYTGIDQSFSSDNLGMAESFYICNDIDSTLLAIDQLSGGNDSKRILRKECVMAFLKKHSEGTGRRIANILKSDYMKKR